MLNKRLPAILGYANSNHSKSWTHTLHRVIAPALYMNEFYRQIKYHLDILVPSL